MESQHTTAAGISRLSIYPPWLVLSVTLLCVLVSVLLLQGGLGFALLQAWDIELSAFMDLAGQSMDLEQRNRMRILSIINQFSMFSLPALAVGGLLFRREIWKYFQMNRMPLLRLLGGCFLLLLALWPTVLASLQFNQSLNLPTWMQQEEDNINALIKGLLYTERGYEIWLNILLIGILPALGEELIFRGIVQQQVERLIKNGHVAVWLSAFIFSAFHLQFAGFLPRMLLGALLGYAFLWSRNLWVPILIHFFNNTIQLLGHHFGLAGEDALTQEAVVNVPWWAILLSLLVAYGVMRIIILPASKGKTESLLPYEN